MAYETSRVCAARSGFPGTYFKAILRSYVEVGSTESFGFREGRLIGDEGGRCRDRSNFSVSEPSVIMEI